MRGIAAVKPGATTGDIGHAIQSFVEPQGMSVVRDFCGHGLGRMFHDEPNIIHVGRPGEGVMLKPGMFFTIEPMINLGKPHVKILSDGWTAVTRDRSLSAQFEHSVGVTADRRRDLHAVAAQRREAADSGIIGPRLIVRAPAPPAQGADDGDGRTGLASATLSRPLSPHLRFSSQGPAARPRTPVRQQADHAAGRVHVRHRRPRGRRLRQPLRRQFSAERHHRQAGGRRRAVPTLHVAPCRQHR